MNFKRTSIHIFRSIKASGRSVSACKILLQVRISPYGALIVGNIYIGSLIANSVKLKQVVLL